MASIDVAVPNYNYGRYLRTCVESILKQEGVSVRVLIIDNASTDDSLEVARSLAAEDCRVQLVLHQRNLGTHASFNRGIDWAEADYFLLLFSDDFLVAGALGRALEVMEKNPSVAFCYGRDVAVRGNDPVPDAGPQPDPVPFRLHSGGAFIERFCRQGVFQIPGSSVIVRTRMQKTAGYYRSTLPHSDDYELWLRLAMLGEIAELDCIQVGLRAHDANRSREFAAHQREHIRHTAAAAESFFANEGRWLEGSDDMRRLASRSLASRAYWSGMSHLARGDLQAFGLLKQAVVMSPLAAVLPPIDYLLNRPDALRRVGFSVLDLLNVFHRRVH